MDSGAAARIAAVAATSGTRVVEIGPGTGTLTLALLATGAAVTAIELDEEMVAILRSREDLADASIVAGDALTFDYSEFARGGPWRVAGNLPYNIATPLITGFIAMKDAGPEQLTVMVQKDVADRFRAQPASKSYGSLSVAVQYAMHVERAFTLPPGVFYPKPKVDSTVVILRRRETPAAAVKNEPRFLQVVRAAFAYRRKTLANSLSLALGLERATIASHLRALGYDTEIRGEQLAIADFARLSDALTE